MLAQILQTVLALTTSGSAPSYDLAGAVTSVVIGYMDSGRKLVVSTGDCENTAELRQLNVAMHNPLLVVQHENVSTGDPFDKDGGYILLDCGDIEKLDVQLALLMGRPSKNPRARFIVVTRTTPELVLSALWRWKIVNALVLVPSGRSVDAFTWFPYFSKDCDATGQTPVLLDRWEDGGFVTGAHLFPEQIPRDFVGCEFRAACFESGPYMLYPHISVAPGGGKRWHYEDGTELRLLHYVAGQRNFSVFCLPPPRNNERWGLEQPDGSWTGLIGDVVSGRADIAITAIMASFERYRFLDASYPHYKESCTWIVPRARHTPRWKSLLLIFSPLIWTLVLLSFLLGSLVLWTLSHVRGPLPPDHRDFAHATSSLFAICSVMLEASLPSMPQTTSMRTFFLFFVFYSMLVTTAYQSSLISQLTNPGFDHQISSVDEILESGMKYGFHPNMDRFFADGSPLSERLMRERQICFSVTMCLDRIAQKQDFAVIHTRNNAEFEIAQHYMDGDGQTLVKTFRTNILSIDHTIYMRRGHVLLHVLDEAVFRATEAGLFGKWRRDVDAAARSRAVSNQGVTAASDDSANVLTVSHLQGAFGLLTLGLVAALLVFGGELFRNRVRARKLLVVLAK